MATIDKYEILRDSQKVDDSGYRTGLRIFAPPLGQLEALAPDYAKDVEWPGEAGPGAMKLYRAKVERQYLDRPDTGKVTAYYRTLVLGQFPTEEKPIRGVLMIDMAGKWE